jgi:hypothetical protein
MEVWDVEINFNSWNAKVFKKLRMYPVSTRDLIMLVKVETTF